MEYQPGHFSRGIGLFGLTMVGVGSIIGSGWLFSAYFAAKLAGPGAIYCWLIGGAIIMLIALTISELASAFPKAGGMVRYFQYSHGSFAGFTLAWANWLGIVASIPSEAVGTVQYISSWEWAWAENLYSTDTNSLTNTGLMAASALLIFYFLLNYWSIKFFTRFISAITVFKVIVPIVAAGMILYSGFHPENFTSVGNTLTPYGWGAVFTAIVTCGIVFSYNGFQSPANLAEEAIKPHINVPLSIILAILITMVVYLLLQIAFIGAVPPEMLIENGWKGINFHSPLVQLALIFQLNFIAILIYINSFVSPSGTGIIYMATSARMLYGMEKNGYMPKFIGALHPKYHVPRYSLLVNLAICFAFMFYFSGWALLVPIISIANIVAFIPGPIALGGLRRIAPDLPRLFKLPFVNIIAPSAFCFISLFLYWAKWPLVGHTILMLAVSMIVYFYYQYKNGWPNFAKQFKGAVWLIVYFAGIVLLSYIGGSDYGGLGLISGNMSQLILVIFSIFIYFWAVRSAWRTPELEEWMHEHHCTNKNHPPKV